MAPERHVQAVLSTSPNLKVNKKFSMKFWPSLHMFQMDEYKLKNHLKAKLVSKVQVILLKWVAGSEQLQIKMMIISAFC